MFFRSIIVLEASASHAAGARFTAGRTGQLRLDWHRTRPLAPGLDREGEWMKQIGEAFRCLRAEIGRMGPVVLTLPPHLLLTRFLATPKVSPAQRDEIVRFEVQQSIPCAPSEMVWGSAIVGETADGYDVMVCAAKLDTVEPLCAAAGSNGFAVHCLLPSPLATLAAAELGRAAAEPGTIILNVGARSCTLLLLDQGRAHLRIFPVGGNGVAPQLAWASTCAFAGPKSRTAPPPDDPLPEGAIAALGTRLAQETTRSVLHFQSQAAAAGPVRVLLCGGFSSLPGLDGELARRMNLPVRRLDFAGAVDFSGAARAENDSAFGSAWCDLLGAAAAHRAQTGRMINLLPARHAARVCQKRRQPWLAAAAAIGAASLTPPILYHCGMIAACHRQNQIVQQQLGPLRALEAALRADSERLAGLRHQTEILQDILDRRNLWISLLADLQERLAEVGDVWFDRLQISPALSGPGRAPADRPPTMQFLVSGRMLDRGDPESTVSDATLRKVKGMLGSIADSPFIASVDGESFDNSQPGVLRFSFVFTPATARRL